MSFPPTPTSESSSHTGQCHCGAVSFRLTLSPPLPQYPVNDFTLEKGQHVLKEYQFATKNVWHQFCGECGSSCFIRLPEKFALLPEGSDPVQAVNVRMLNDVDYEKLQLNKVDGKSA